MPKELAEDLRELHLEIVPRGFVAAMEVQSTLMGKIREAQKDDKEIAEIHDVYMVVSGESVCEEVHPSRVNIIYLNSRVRGKGLLGCLYSS